MAHDEVLLSKQFELDEIIRLHGTLERGWKILGREIRQGHAEREGRDA